MGNALILFVPAGVLLAVTKRAGFFSPAARQQ